MGEEDMTTAVAHVVLGVVAGNSLSKVSDASFVHPGMHVNCLVHAVLGCLHYSGKGELAEAYKISMAATRYLPLPCLMADMYRGFSDNSEIMRALHLLSGIVPFVLAVSGKDNKELGHVCVVVNIISVAYYTINNSNNQWGWCLVGASILSYFVAPQSAKIMYPLGLAAMEYCSHRVFFSRGIASGPPTR